MANVSLRNTKNTIYKAYSELLEENKKLSSKLNVAQRSLVTKEKALADASKSAKSSKRAQSKSDAPTQAPKTIVKIVEKAANVGTISGILAMLKSINEGINSAISKNAEKQTIEAETLADLQDNIANEKEALKTLYDIEFEDGTLDQLIETYEQERDSFNENYQTEYKAYVEEWTGKQKAWQKEQEEERRLLAEEKNRLEKDKKRESQEHVYNLNLGRALETDEYSQKKKLLGSELQELREVKSISWKEKEKEVYDKETEFTEYEIKFEELPEKLSKAVRKAEHEGAAIIDKDAKISADLYAKEVESEQKLFELRINALRSTSSKQERQINDLSKQLENALKQAQNLAIKAIEGASYNESFTAIREIAIEQAKHSHKSK